MGYRIVALTAAAAVALAAAAGDPASSATTAARLARAGVRFERAQLVDDGYLLSFDLKLTQRGGDIDTVVRIALAATRLRAQPDGTFVASGTVSVTGGWRSDTCSATASFMTPATITGRRDRGPPETFRLDVVPRERTHAVTMACRDPDVSRSVPMPVYEWLRGPSVTPATVGATTPVHATLVVETLRAEVEGTTTLTKAPARP